MLLTILNKIPLLQSLIYYDFKSHQAATKKFLFLWFLSSLPIVFVVFLSPVPSGDLPFLDKLLDRAYDSISAAEAFVYSAAFMSPIFYILVERIQDIEGEVDLSEKMMDSFKSIFKGYTLVFTVALISLLLSAGVYSSVKTSEVLFEKTFLYVLIKDHVYFVYLYALFCWYMSILASGGSPSNFVSDNRNAEESLSKQFSDRMKSKGGVRS